MWRSWCRSRGWQSPEAEGLPKPTDGWRAPQRGLKARQEFVRRRGDTGGRCRPLASPKVSREVSQRDPWVDGGRAASGESRGRLYT